MSLTSFRGTAQANSTSQTRFRVVWRDDTFTTPQDAHDNMFTLSQSPLGGSGRQRQARPMFSQSDDLSVPREVACDLAAWAKREFPSVTHIDSCTSAVMGRGRAQDSKRLAPIGSLAAVRKGVQTTVRAWVLDTSAVERLWTWESTGGAGVHLHSSMLPQVLLQLLLACSVAFPARVFRSRRLPAADVQRRGRLSGLGGNLGMFDICPCTLFNIPEFASKEGVRCGSVSCTTA